MKLKGKNASFFTAQPHHMRLWKPIFDKLVSEGLKIKVFTTHTPYPFEYSVIPYNIEPIFIEEYLDSEIVEKVEKEYIRLSRELSQLHVSKNFMFWIHQWHTAGELRDVIREYYLFKKILKLEKIDIIFALHEINRWGKMLAYLSFRMEIPFVTLQEGAYYPLPYSYNLRFHSEFSLANFLWGKQTADDLKMLGNAPEKFVIVGDTHLDEVLNIAVNRKKQEKLRKKVKKDFNIPGKSKIVLIVQGTLPGKGVPNMEDFIENELPSETDEFVFILKIHPNFLKSFVERIKAKYKEKKNLRIVQDYDSYDLLASSSVVLSLGVSTLTFEAYPFNKPVADFSPFKNEKPYFAERKVAVEVKPGKVLEGIKEATERFREDSELKKRVEEWKRYVFYKLDGRASIRVREWIERILSIRDYYKQWNPPKVAIKKEKKGISWNLVAMSSPKTVATTISQLLSFVESEDEINIIYPLQIAEIYEEIKKVLERKGFLNFYGFDGKNLSQFFNFALSISKGNKVFLTKEGVIPLLFKPYFREREEIFGMFLLSPEEKIVHAGVVFDHNNVVYNIYEGIEAKKVNLPEEREYRAVDIALLAPSSLLEKIGGFDEEIHDRYSIVDFSLRASESGKKVLVSTRFSGVVLENLAFSPPDEEAHIRFYTKWRGKTATNLFRYTEEDGIDIYRLYKEL